MAFGNGSISGSPFGSGGDTSGTSLERTIGETLTATESQSATVLAVASLTESATTADSSVVDAHKYWRIFFPGAGQYENPATYLNLYTVEMHATAGGADQCSGGTATSDTANGAHTANSAFDGNGSTYWESASSPSFSDKWLAYQFAQPTQVVEYKIVCGPSPSEAPVTWYLQYSDDGSSWTTADVIQIVESLFSAGESRTYTVDPKRNLQTWWRLNVSDTNSPTSTYINISELSMATSIGGSNVCTGGTASASSHNGNKVSGNAFDGDNNSYWEGIYSPWYIRYRFGSSVNIVEYSVRNGPFSFEGPKAWTLEYSSNGVDWTVADTRSSQTGWSAGETRSFHVAQNVSADLTEAGSASESTSGTGTMYAADSESGSASEDTSAINLKIADQTDAATANEAGSATLSAVATSTELATASETNSGITSAYADATEAVSATESTTGDRLVVSIQDESITASDAEDSSNAATATASEAVTSTEETSSVKDTSDANGETSTASDSVNAVSAYAASQDEATLAATSQNGTAQVSASDTESVSAAETVSGIRLVSATQSEAATATATQTGARTTSATLSASATATSSTGSTANLRPSQVEAANAAETGTGVKRTVGFVTDVANAQAISTTGKQVSASVTESTNATDFLDKPKVTKGRGKQLTVSITETANAQASQSRNWSGTASIVESGSALVTSTASYIGQVILTNEAVPATDVTAATSNTHTAQEESATAVDALDAVVSTVANQVEATVASDAQARTVDTNVTITESANAIDISPRTWAGGDVQTEFAFAIDFNNAYKNALPLGGAVEAVAATDVCDAIRIVNALIEEPTDFLTLLVDDPSGGLLLAADIVEAVNIVDTTDRLLQRKSSPLNTWEVPGHTRVLDVPKQERDYNVGGGNRVLIVPENDRTYDVPGSDRTLEN